MLQRRVGAHKVGKLASIERSSRVPRRVDLRRRARWSAARHFAAAAHAKKCPRLAWRGEQMGCVISRGTRVSPSSEPEPRLHAAPATQPVPEPEPEPPEQLELDLGSLDAEAQAVLRAAAQLG